MIHDEYLLVAIGRVLFNNGLKIWCHPPSRDPKVRVNPGISPSPLGTRKVIDCN